LSASPLYGLILAGGSSSRMQRDKAALQYQGRSQLERAFELATRHVSQVFVSVRANQRHDPVRSAKPMIVDSAAGEGPIVGIRSALAAHRQAAWLVLACDLPFLNRATLQHLIAHRASSRVASAYRSSFDGLPEPLCTIYEPGSRALLASYVEAGRNCPRKFLAHSDTLLLPEPNPRALDNINTPTEYSAVMSQVNTPKQIRVQYYALLREQAGRREEALTTTAPTPRELYAELAGRYPFSLTANLLRVAINNEFGDWSAPLKDGDAVVFMPPVAGG